MNNERRSIGQMPYRRRQDGLCGMERREELQLWTMIISILTVLAAAANNPLLNHVVAGGLVLVGAMIAQATALRTMAWNRHDRIDKVTFPCHMYFLSCPFSLSSALLPA